MEYYGFVAPTTVEEIFEDYCGRRTGLLQALTTDVDNLCYLCYPGEKKLMCLYGHPNGKWEVSFPPNRNELSPNLLPQPVRGINLTNNDTLSRQDWLALVASQTDSWLLALSYYFVSELDLTPDERQVSRSRLFDLINNHPSIFKEVTGLPESEISILVYKVGECMQQLFNKLWKDYESSSNPEKTGDFASNGPTVEVQIPPEHVSATNPQVKGRKLWGTDIYTDDSDLVAVLMHTGYCRSTVSNSPSTMQELRTIIRVLPPQDYYTSKLRNDVRSRAWEVRTGCSYRVEQCYILKKGGETIELKPSFTQSSTMEPTIAPKAVQQVTIQYNLCNEPWMKYSMSVVADKGLEKPLFTSARLKKGEVLYLETHSCRYELCFAEEKTKKAIQASQQQSSHDANKSLPQLKNGDKTDSEDSLIDVFRWSRCKKPLPQKLMRSIGFPLPLDHIEVLEENLDWEDILWSQTGVWIAGKEYKLARVHFLSPN